MKKTGVYFAVLIVLAAFGMTMFTMDDRNGPQFIPAAVSLSLK